MSNRRNQDYMEGKKMNLHKKHEGETVKALKEFNAHLRNEVRELKDKLKAEEQKGKGFFHDMIETQLDDFDLHIEIENLTAEVEKLKAENASLKSQKGSIFTGPSKRETELERQLESECARANELSAQLDTVSKRYEETQNAVTELIDENTMLKAKVEKYEKTKKGDANS